MYHYRPAARQEEREEREEDMQLSSQQQQEHIHQLFFSSLGSGHLPLPASTRIFFT
jgi:hypothetical protein